MKCPYCGEKPVRTNGKEIYPGNPTLWSKKFILCRPCDAYVGCHEGTDFKPYGRLANKALRALKVEAHKHFDPLWQEDGMTRTQAYGWLSLQMDLPFNKTHIGEFDNEQCRTVIELCKKKRGLP